MKKFKGFSKTACTALSLLVISSVCIWRAGAVNDGGVHSSAEEVEEPIPMTGFTLRDRQNVQAAVGRIYALHRNTLVNELWAGINYYLRTGSYVEHVAVHYAREHVANVVRSVIHNWAELVIEAIEYISETPEEDIRIHAAYYTMFDERQFFIELLGGLTLFTDFCVHNIDAFGACVDDTARAACAAGLQAFF